MIIPREDWMIIELVKEQDSKIALPDTVDITKDESAMFTVKAIGPGYFNEYTGRIVTSDVKVGDTVIVAGFSMAKIKYKGKKILLTRAREVALIIRGK